MLIIVFLAEFPKLLKLPWRRIFQIGGAIVIAIAALITVYYMVFDVSFERSILKLMAALSGFIVIIVVWIFAAIIAYNAVIRSAQSEESD